MTLLWKLECEKCYLYLQKSPKVQFNKFSFQVDENYNHNYELKKFLLFTLLLLFCKEFSFHESIFDNFLVVGVFLKQAG